MYLFTAALPVALKPVPYSNPNSSYGSTWPEPQANQQPHPSLPQRPRFKVHCYFNSAANPSDAITDLVEEVRPPIPTLDSYPILGPVPPSMGLRRTDYQPISSVSVRDSPGHATANPNPSPFLRFSRPWSPPGPQLTPFLCYCPHWPCFKWEQVRSTLYGPAPAPSSNHNPHPDPNQEMIQFSTPFSIFSGSGPFWPAHGP